MSNKKIVVASIKNDSQRKTAQYSRLLFDKITEVQK